MKKPRREEAARGGAGEGNAGDKKKKRKGWREMGVSGAGRTRRRK